MFIEMIAARKYYGRHATGSVVLTNGYVSFHGPTSEAADFVRNILARCKNADLASE